MKRLPESVLLILAYTPFARSRLSLPSPPYTPPDPSNSTSSGPLTQWSTLLGNLLYFYDEQRSGTLPNDNRVPWRNDSALDDGKDVGIDLSGGFYDAGDYVKYTFPMSFAIMSVCWGALDAGRGYDIANQTAYLDDTLRWGLDWLIKAHPSPRTLYVQVGDTDLDNAYWGGDRDIPTPRPSHQINDTSPGTEAAAQASAAFSSCSALYANRTLSAASPPAALANSKYASRLLDHARDLYSFATSAGGGKQTYQTVVPSAGEAYASSGYGDELAIAALFLALAESDKGKASAAYGDAVGHYYTFNLGSQMKVRGVFNWDGKEPGVVVLGAQIAKANSDVVGGSNTTLQTWQGVAEQYFDALVGGTGPTHLTPGGLLYFPGDSDDASLNPALNAAMLMARYASSGLATSDENGKRYANFAQRQLDYALGNNPMFVPYVVGTHPNSPHNPHSAPAAGGSQKDIDNIDTVPAQEAYVIYGAVVGGPDAEDQFWDRRSDWVQCEVALDYNAPLLTLAAQVLARGDLVDPFYVQVRPGAYEEVRPGGAPCNAAISEGCPHRRGLGRGGKIAVGVVVGVVGAVVVGLGAYWVASARKKRY